MGINVHVLDSVAVNSANNLPTTTTALVAFANPAAAGSNVLIAAVAGKKIRVLGLMAVAAAANSIKLQSAAADITGLFALAANGQLSLSFNEHGWCETVAGDALNINLSAAAAVGVQVVYTLI